MASLWPSKPPVQDSAMEKDIVDVADTGLADVGLPPPQPLISVPMSRPQLQRNQPQAPPPHQPPPPPAPQSPASADSLSLAQLKRIVNEFPRIDPNIYTFEYADTSNFEEEVEEWFCYDTTEYKRLYRAQETFRNRWGGIDKSWMDADHPQRQKFMTEELKGLRNADLQGRGECLRSILHVILGVWDETAGLSKQDSETEEGEGESKGTNVQLIYMQSGIQLVADCDGLPTLYDLMKSAFDRLWSIELAETRTHEDDDELDNVTTIVYLILEGVRDDPESLDSVKNRLFDLNPNLLIYLMSITAKLRWDETNEMPQTRIFLLLWKAVLLMLGGIPDIAKAKKETDELANIDADSNLIVASPLDYHVFRQEIISKYPAYIPPDPILPLEPDNNSILPPLPNRPSRASNNGILNPPNVNSSGASILHQPVHIATPAPSPPPSPPVGGKAGKKQNYQTNQNFPFLYPPLDSSSSGAGGKGAAGLQDILVGRRWEGSDIPKSILEAGDLFAKRVRMTRAVRQLWEERERFLKFERGWDDGEDVDEIDLDAIPESNDTKTTKSNVDYGPSEDVQSEVKQKLDLVEEFYRKALPHLQSIVIVLLKAVLINVTALITQPGQPGVATSFRSETNLRQNGVQGQNRQPESANSAAPAIDTSLLPIEEVDAMRTREITAKAVSGILLLLLKWFKVSHILKFEYLTQLLLDSNYLPLILKLFAHQEIEKVVESKTDRERMNFFSFCLANSKNEVPAEAESEPSSEDEAVPPPIKLNRPAPPPIEEDRLPALAFENPPPPPKEPPPQSVPMRREGTAETEEPDPQPDPSIPSAPSEPITDFSWRNFFSTINCLRIMQKICKNKAHRNLLLVQYKSSNILKKSLKIPQQELRLYTLKLFKNQVPYCGRKWRQGNMRVITAVYLHCRPELRDDWLAGSDVDAEVEEALPLEQALRALTHWTNVKRYPTEMGADRRVLDEEKDFFVRELEKLEGMLEELGLGGSGAGGEESVDGWPEGQPVAW